MIRLSRALGAAGLAITGMILTSVSVQLWIEPLLAFSFNRMSWIAPLANLVVVPFSSVVLAAGITASLANGLPFFGPAMVALAGSLASHPRRIRRREYLSNHSVLQRKSRIRGLRTSGTCR